ncbi:hypothetical protein ADUPG1_013255, partial [Aduncisulcus paluster]
MADSEIDIEQIQPESIHTLVTTLQCTFCLCLSYPDPIRLSCGHVFHQHCVEKWVRQHHSCPMCKAHVKLNFGYSVDRLCLRILSMCDIQCGSCSFSGTVSEYCHHVSTVHKKPLFRHQIAPVEDLIEEKSVDDACFGTKRPRGLRITPADFARRGLIMRIEDDDLHRRAEGIPAPRMRIVHGPVHDDVFAIPSPFPEHPSHQHRQYNGLGRNVRRISNARIGGRGRGRGRGRGGGGGRTPEVVRVHVHRGTDGRLVGQIPQRSSLSPSDRIAIRAMEDRESKKDKDMDDFLKNIQLASTPQAEAEEERNSRESREDSNESEKELERSPLFSPPDGGISLFNPDGQGSPIPIQPLPYFMDSNSSPGDPFDIFSPPTKKITSASSGHIATVSSSSPSISSSNPILSPSNLDISPLSGSRVGQIPQRSSLSPSDRIAIRAMEDRESKKDKDMDDFLKNIQLASTPQAEAEEERNSRESREDSNESEKELERSPLFSPPDGGISLFNPDGQGSPIPIQPLPYFMDSNSSPGDPFDIFSPPTKKITSASSGHIATVSSSSPSISSSNPILSPSNLDISPLSGSRRGRLRLRSDHHPMKSEDDDESSSSSSGIFRERQASRLSEYDFVSSRIVGDIRSFREMKRSQSPSTIARKFLSLMLARRHEEQETIKHIKAHFATSDQTDTSDAAFMDDLTLRMGSHMSLTRKYNELQKEMKEKMSASAARDVTRENKIEKLSRQVGDLEKTISREKETIDGMNDMLKKKDDRFIRLRQKYDMSKKNEEELRKKIAELEFRNKQMQKDLREESGSQFLPQEGIDPPISLSSSYSQSTSSSASSGAPSSHSILGTNSALFPIIISQPSISGSSSSKDEEEEEEDPSKHFSRDKKRRKDEEEEDEIEEEDEERQEKERKEKERKERKREKHRERRRRERRREKELEDEKEKEKQPPRSMDSESSILTSEQSATKSKSCELSREKDDKEEDERDRDSHIHVPNDIVSHDIPQVSGSSPAIKAPILVYGERID